MRSVVEAAEDRSLDTTDGVRIVEDDGSWTLVLPDPTEAVTHLWAEGHDMDTAQALLERWAGVVERAAGANEGGRVRPCVAGWTLNVCWL